MDQDLQQGVFFSTGFLNPLIEIVVARVRGKQFIELRFQLEAFFCIRFLAIRQQPVIILPIALAEVFQLLPM